MSQELFDFLSSLRAERLEDTPLLQKRLHHLASLGRKTSQLKVVPRFLNILEILASLDSSRLEQARPLIFEGLDALWDMAEGRVNGKEGARTLSALSQSARDLMQPFLRRGFLCSPIFWEQAAFDLQKDSSDLRLALQNNDRKKALYMIRLIKDTFSFAGMPASAEAAEAAELWIDQSGEELAEKSGVLDGVLDFFVQESLFLETFKDDEEHILRHEELSEGLARTLILGLDTDQQGSFASGVTLTAREINALLSEYEEYPVVFTSFGGDGGVLPLQHDKLSGGADKSYSLLTQHELNAALASKQGQPAAYRVNPEREDLLVKLAGKLFLKQELLKSLVPEEQKILAGEKWDSLDDLTKRLKEKLFRNYYTSMKDLLGKELRNFVQSAVDRMGKKIKLGVRGENSEVLSREGAFVKEMVFALVENSLNNSIELPVRRTALDKSETAWLLIEFEDTGGEFEVQVRDDGRGLSASSAVLEEIRNKAEGKGGSLTINSAENEYLKVSMRFPMKKLLTKSILCRCGDTRFLIPLRSVRTIVTADSPENPALSKDSRCLGQIALSALMDLEKCPNRMALVCAFGEELIVYTVEAVLGEVEALVEDADVPLPPCSDGAVILRDDQVGFLINERSLYTKSLELLDKRAETLQALY